MPAAARRRAAASVEISPLLAAAWQRLAPAADTAPADLLGPLVDQANAVVADLARSPAGGAPEIGTLGGYLSALRDGPPAGTGPEPPGRAEARTVLDQAAAAAAGATGDRVSTPTGSVDRDVYLTYRLVTAIAAGRELPEPLVPDRAELRACVRALARALAELAPGRSVELRVPPHAAVQCVPGPRHTRGTPPNVVEIEPLAFFDLATGRRHWDETYRSGELRASGERADLRPWLPLVADATAS